MPSSECARQPTLLGGPALAMTRISAISPGRSARKSSMSPCAFSSPISAQSLAGRWGSRATRLGDGGPTVGVGGGVARPGLLMPVPNASRSWSSVQGLLRKSSMPAARQRSRSSPNALAVNARMRICAPPPAHRATSRRRISRVASKPSISGIWQSMRMRS